MPKTQYFFCFIGAIFLMAGAAACAGAANIQYPVLELGNCQSEAACKIYCDKPENIEACLAFAEKNNLMSPGEIDMARKFMATNDKRPGGCATKDVCETYCDDISHIDECLAFAIENNILAPAELAEAKKVQSAIKKGIKPPPCGNKQACDEYCDSSDHMEECIVFGEAAGFIQGKELEDAKKMLQAVKRGVKPPPCRGKGGCDEYCSRPENMEVCISFAMEAGFMSGQEKADAQKMLAAIKKGVKPPNCKSKSECDIYCQQEEHFEECLNFAEAAGFMSADDAAMARKTGGKGPGGCKDKDECEAFCNDPDNQETCFNFGLEQGLIPEEDLKKMEEGKQQMKQGLEQAPPEVLDCLNAQLGNDMLEKLKTGAVMPPREIGESMRGCYEKIGPPQGQGGPGEGGSMAPPACQTAEECQNMPQAPLIPGENMTPGAQGNGPGGQPGDFQPTEGFQPNCENCGFGPGPEPPLEQPGEQQPPEPFQPPSESPSPAPAGGLLTPEKFLASLISPFIQLFRLEK